MGEIRTTYAILIAWYTLYWYLKTEIQLQGCSSHDFGPHERYHFLGGFLTGGWQTIVCSCLIRHFNEKTRDDHCLFVI